MACPAARCIQPNPADASPSASLVVTNSHRQLSPSAGTTRSARSSSSLVKLVTSTTKPSWPWVSHPHHASSIGSNGTSPNYLAAGFLGHPSSAGIHVPPQSDIISSPSDAPTIDVFSVPHSSHAPSTVVCAKTALLASAVSVSKQPVLVLLAPHADRGVMAVELDGAGLVAQTLSRPTRPPPPQPMPSPASPAQPSRWPAHSALHGRIATDILRYTSAGPRRMPTCPGHRAGASLLSTFPLPPSAASRWTPSRLSAFVLFPLLAAQPHLPPPICQSPCRWCCPAAADVHPWQPGRAGWLAAANYCSKPDHTRCVQQPRVLVSPHASTCKSHV